MFSDPLMETSPPKTAVPFVVVPLDPLEPETKK
jgi:hypothetical protein